MAMFCTRSAYVVTAVRRTFCSVSASVARCAWMFAWAALVSATVLPPRKIGWVSVRVVNRPFRMKKVGERMIE